MEQTAEARYQSHLTERIQALVTELQARYRAAHEARQARQSFVREHADYAHLYWGDDTNIDIASWLDDEVLIEAYVREAEAMRRLKQLARDNSELLHPYLLILSDHSPFFNWRSW